MPAPAYMKFYTKDYVADTAHLTTLQHGAYLLLILHHWHTGRLPTDDLSLRTIAKMSEEEWMANRIAIACLWHPDWTHKRIDGELAKFKATAQKRSKAGKVGAKSRWANKKSHNGKPHANRIANAQQSHAIGIISRSNEEVRKEELEPPLVQHLPHNQVLDSQPSFTTIGPVSKKTKPAVRGERWPVDAVVPDEWIVDGLKLGLTVEATRFETGAFVDWALGAGANGVKRDWRATWRNWLRRIARDRPRSGQLGRGGKPNVFDALADDMAKARAKIHGD